MAFPRHSPYLRLFVLVVRVRCWDFEEIHCGLIALVSEQSGSRR